ncbi:MAG: hypothetical protein WB784_10090 [Rhodanobacteraceae bacterium]
MLHAAPQEPWTAEDRLPRIASSRLALAARFKQVLDEAPMHYPGRWRACSSPHVACATHDRNRYDSPGAFQRAFKRHFGAPPAAWRLPVEN